MELHGRFAAALGTEGALDLPTRPIDLAAGRAIYQRDCASCHGSTGQGDGPASAGMNPPPPALGSPEAMHDVTPALMFRIVSVGIAGTPMAGFSERLTPDERRNVVSYINSLRGAPARVAEGEGLYAQRCASCHGATGKGDGALASALSKLPPELASFAWQAERSDLQIASVIRSGVSGTAMPPSRELADADVAGLVAYVRTLAARDSTVGTETLADGAANAQATAARVMALIDEALVAARAGRSSDAG